MPAYDPLFFNIDPYYNDFDEQKKYLKLLFRPGFALQARELSQMQSILQNQIERFGNFVFNDGSMVYGGQITEIPTFVSSLSGFQSASVNNLLDSVVEFVDSQSEESSFAKIVFAQRIAEEDYIYYQFLSGNSITAEGTSISGNVGGLAFNAELKDFSENGLVVLVDEGIRYTNGYFVYHEKQKIGLFDIDNQGDVSVSNLTKSVGFEVNKDIISSQDDRTLLDPSFGSFNFNAPGADRFRIDLVLTQKNIGNLKTASTTPFSRTDFIEIIRIVDGETVKKEKYAELGSLEETFARRTYDESGHYIVDPFDITIIPAETGPNSSEELISKLESGKAYIFGYEFETQGNSFLTHKKSREKNQSGEVPFGYDIGSYALVNFSGISGGLSGFEFSSGGNLKFPRILFDSYSGSETPTTPNNGLRFNVSGALDIERFSPGVTLYFNQTSTFSGLSENEVTRGKIRSLQIISDGISNAPQFFTRLEVDNFSQGTPEEIQNFVPFFINTFSGDWGSSLTASDSILINFSSPSITGGPLASQIGSSRAFNIQRQSGNIYKLFMEDVQFNASFNMSNVKRLFVEGSTGNPIFYLTENSPRLYNNQKNSRIFPTRFKEVVESFEELDFVLDIHYNNLQDDLSGNVITILKEDFAEQIGPNVASNQNPISLQNCSFISLFDNIGEVGGEYRLQSVNSQNSANPNQVEITISRPIVGNLRGVISQRTRLNNTRKKTENTVVASLTGSNDKQKYFSYNGKLLTDVYEINEIWLNSSTKLDSNLYALDDGQKDTYYDFSKVTLSPSSQFNLNGLTASVSYFSHSGNGPFLGGISYEDDYENIPPFIRNDGEEISLRSSVDFRPVRFGSLNEFSLTGPYGIPSSIFDGYDHSSNYSYYLGRIDKVVLSRNKTFNVIEGYSSETPSPPPDDPDSMTLYSIVFNPYTFDENDVIISQEDNRRFTMKDIGNLEKRVETIEKYTTLSLFEQEAKNTPIYDEFGFEISKKAILTDQFQDGGNGNILNPDFICSVNKENGELAPSQVVDSWDMESEIKSFSIGLTSSDGIIHPIIEEEISFIQNNFGNNFRQINSNEVVDFLGSLKMNKQFDKWIDDTKEPLVKNNSNGSNNSWLVGDRSFNLNGNYWDQIWFGKERNALEKEFQKISPKRTSSQANTSSTKKIGSFTNPLSSVRNISEKIVDKSVVPYCRERTNVVISAKFLKPETNHFVFFDGELLTTDGVGITSDEFGKLSYSFDIPKGKYTTGKKLIRVMDVDDFNKIEKSTSSGDIIYYASGMPKDNESQNYIRPLIHKRESSSSENITNDPILRDFQRTDKKSKSSKDTLSQLFTVDAEKYSSGLFVSSIEIYINAYPISGIDANLPVRLELRPTINGYPSPSRVIAESIVYRDAIDLSQSEAFENSSNIQARKVKFNFDYPVYLIPGEYAICVESNSDLYSLVTYVLPSTSNNTFDEDKTNFIDPMLGNLFLPKNTGRYERITNEFMSLAINRASFDSGENRITFSDAIMDETDMINQARTSIEGIFPSNTKTSLKIGNSSYPINKTLDITKVNQNNSWSIELDCGSIVSPCIDTKASSILYSKYKMNNIEDIEKELSPIILNRSLGSRYISKSLNLLSPATNIRVIFDSSQPPSTRIEVFGRYLTVGSNESLEEIPYRRMFLIPNRTALVSEDSFLQSEYTFRGFVPEFSSFNIKIVFYSPNKEYPRIKNLKVIAT
jgi:hypothetical protein